MTLEELQAKIALEYEELIKVGLEWSVEHDENEHVYFVDKAYEFAHYNEIKYFFDNMDEEDYLENWQELVEGKEGEDILQGIYNYWLDFSHPERYNFFCYEDLIPIIKDWFENYGVH